MKKNKQREKQRKPTQHGAIELALFAIIAIFAILITGYFTSFNSSSTNNNPAPDSQWVYIILPSPSPQQSYFTLQESNLHYFTIPKIVYGKKGAGGNQPHSFGLKFNTNYVDPAIYAKKFATILQKTSHTLQLPAHAYAAPPSMSVLQYYPQPGYQDGVGSCTAWTTDYDMYGYYSIRSGGYPFPGGLDEPQGAGSDLGGFAPMYTYSQLCTTTSCGTAFIDNFKIMTSQGVDRRDFYPQGDFSIGKVTASETSMASNYKIASYTTLFATYPNGGGATGEEDIKNAIASGDPVGIGMYVLPTFDTPDTSIPYIDNRGLREKDNHGIQEGHAVMAFGYDTQGLWIVNSWGGGWGKNGTAELSWSYVQNQVDEAYTIKAITPQNPPTLPPSPIPSPSPGQSPAPSPDPCSTLNLNLDPINCGVNGSNIGLFCGGNCGVGGNTGILYQCQGQKMIGQTACSPTCVTCPGAPRADQCGVDTHVCSQGAPGVSITPGPGTQCKASNGVCAPQKLCSANCSNCGVSNDCQAGYSCCH